MRQGYSHVAPGTRPFEVLKRVASGVFADGTIHAGNLAYMAILTLFPFFITATAVFSAFGRSEAGIEALDQFLRTVPPSVAETIDGPVREVLQARTGWLLVIGGVFGLWTVGSLIETIRDILRRAYGTRPSGPFWRYRLGSVGVIVGAVLLLMLSFSLQVVITAVIQTINLVLPQFADLAGSLTLSRFVPGIGLFVAIYLLFWALTPSQYRGREYPKWPGALLTALWWIAVTTWLPPIIANLADYDMTYGSLAGVMIALFFFWLVGLGVVVGAELNAAMAEPEGDINFIGQADERAHKAKGMQ